MVLPKMICFDYGETLVHEQKFDGQKGYAEILKYAKKNKYGRTASELAKCVAEINDALGRFDMARRDRYPFEVTDDAFQAYLFESQGIELSVPYSSIVDVFWDVSAPGTATEGVEDFLAFLRENNVSTSVISNISFNEATLSKRLSKIFPNHKFDYVIASSEYMFRKPNRRLFELVLEKSGVNASETWHCGDQYECDVVGAGNAGIQPVLYNAKRKYERQFDEEVIVITKWEELKKRMLLLF